MPTEDHVVGSFNAGYRPKTFVLMVHGDDQEIARARDLLKFSGLSSFEEHRAKSEATAAPLA